MQAIRSWFRWRDKAPGSGENNPWAASLRALRNPNGQPPRQTPGWQIYHAEQAYLIKQEYNERKTDKEHGIAL